MFWLLACARPPPSIDLPVVPPPAVNATAVPAVRFLGPLDLGNLDGAALCEVDPAALSKAGRFGWRVLVATPDGVRPFDGALGGAPPKSAKEETNERVKQWEAADGVYEARCGGAVRTPVLLAVDGASPSDAGALLAVPVAGLDVHLLVADPEPGPPVPAPPRRPDDLYLTLSAGRSWAVVGNRPEFEASEHSSAHDAVARVVTAGHPDVVLVADPTLAWFRVVEGLDALAGIGIAPVLGLVVGKEAPASPVPFQTTRITLGETVSVLRLEFPSWPGTPAKGERRRGLLLQMIGTSGSVDDTFGGVPAAFPDDWLDRAPTVPDNHTPEAPRAP